MNSKLLRLPILLFATLPLLLAGCDSEPAAPTERQPAAWLAPFGDGVLQARFEATLHSWFRERDIKVRSVDEGLVEIGGQRRSFDIVGIAADCAELDPGLWRETLDGQLGPMIETSAELGDWQTPPFDEAKERLRLRIYPLAFLDAAGMKPADVVQRADLEGTATCVTLDRDDSAMILPIEALGEWGRDAEQVIAVARANTERALDGSLQVESREVGDLATLREIAGDSYYASTAALWLGDWPEMLGEHGAFVAIPWRHSVLVLPFDDAQAARAVPGLYALAAEVAAEESAGVTPSVWWRRPDGGFEAIEIREIDGQPAAVPPVGLAELLQKLGMR